MNSRRLDTFVPEQYPISYCFSFSSVFLQSISLRALRRKEEGNIMRLFLSKYDKGSKCKEKRFTRHLTNSVGYGSSGTCQMAALALERF